MVIDWRERLVCSRCGPRQIDMVVTGTKRRREWRSPDAAPRQPLGWGRNAHDAECVIVPGSRYGEMKPQSVRALTTANSPLPSVLGLGIAYGLPLHVGNCIGAAAGERLNVILAVAGASARRAPGGWAGMLPLELPRYLTGSVLPG